MQNEPNLGQSQIFITVFSTTNYNEKSTLDTWSKRTQTKPILSAMAGKIALSEVEGPVVFDIEEQLSKCTIAIYGKILGR